MQISQKPRFSEKQFLVFGIEEPGGDSIEEICLKTFSLSIRQS